MKTVGENVQEAIDLMNSGLFQYAIAPAAAALGQTAQKAYEKELASESDYEKFVRENWRLIAFMGLPRALPLPLSVPFALKRIAPSFNVHHGAEEIVLLVIRETLKAGKLPGEFEFFGGAQFEAKDGKFFVPASLIYGLLGAVIFHASNREETIGDRYWMNVSDFRMFISELWGRRDLAERIINFYLE